MKNLEESLNEERRQRDEAFLRNAQMSQQIQLAQCDLRNSQQENDDLLVQLNVNKQVVTFECISLYLTKQSEVQVLVFLFVTR